MWCDDCNDIEGAHIRAVTFFDFQTLGMHMCDFGETDVYMFSVLYSM